MSSCVNEKCYVAFVVEDLSNVVAKCRFHLLVSLLRFILLCTSIIPPKQFCHVCVRLHTVCHKFGVFTVHTQEGPSVHGYIAS